jgi:hypothetical protein
VRSAPGLRHSRPGALLRPDLSVIEVGCARPQADCDFSLIQVKTGSRAPHKTLTKAVATLASFGPSSTRSMTYKGALGCVHGPARNICATTQHFLGLWQGLGFSIRFDVRPMKTGPTWMVVVTFPDRADLQVTDFGTEADARKWIASESQEWLRKLGYGND